MTDSQRFYRNKGTSNNMKELDNNWKAICDAIARALFRESVLHDNTDQIWNDLDWEMIISETQIQAISPLVKAGIGVSLTSEINQKWEDINAQYYMHYIRVLYAEKELTNLLNGAGIRFVILKGTACAIYYPEPYLRVMGDIDLLVPPIDFDRARRILLENAYELDEAEKDNLRHILYRKDGILFELHRRFSNDELDSAIDPYIDRCMDKLKVGNIDGTEFPILPELENGIVILSHVRNHLLSGLGLRQVLDWMMYVWRVVDDKYWEDFFMPVAQAHNLETLAITLSHMCQMYFGLPEAFTWCMNADEELCERLMENIRLSGNFGQNNGVGKSVERILVRLRRKDGFHYLQSAGQYNWKACQRHKWLMPFAWIYQIGRYIKLGILTKLRGGLLTEDFCRSSDRFKLLRDLDIFGEG